MHRLLLLFFFAVSFVTNAQSIKISGKVVNAEDQKPLAFSHLLMLNKELGTSANEEGVFAFMAPREFKDLQLRISHVGFQSRILKISDLAGKTIALDPIEENLKEVFLTNVLNDKQFVYRPGWKNKSVGFGNLNGGLYPSTVARYYKKPAKFSGECYLKEIELYFVDVDEQSKLNPKFRLHIYGVDEKGMPGKELAGDLVLQKKAAENKMKIELLDERIRIPQSGFFVGVEHLFISENRFTETKNYYINDSLVAEDYAVTKFAPIFKAEIVKKEDINTWFFSPSGWRKITEFDLRHKVFDGGVPIPIFKIKLTD